MNIWVVNPFDQIPNESDLPLRFWSLCQTLVQHGHDVIWWSSDFSHRHKVKRKVSDNSYGFSVRLIRTPPYKKNVSLARILNHRAFASGFLRDAMYGIKNKQLKEPDRIIVSLPPLGVAESAFKIRDWVNKKEKINSKHFIFNHNPVCEVIVDIMDAWPEAFYRVIPKSFRILIGRILFFSMHRSALKAYKNADKITAVGQSYIDLAKIYLKIKKDKLKVSTKEQKKDSSIHTQKPFHLCYHGTDMSRFESIINKGNQQGIRVSKKNMFFTNSTHKFENFKKPPLRAVYIGAMGNGYDLQTLVNVAGRWKQEGIMPFQIHFAGKGTQLGKLKARCRELGLFYSNEEFSINSKFEFDNKYTLSSSPSFVPIVFHGFLQKDAINKLLLSSDIALVTNRSETLVACPYKAGEYAAAGLPIVSCLEGELSTLLRDWDSGTTYTEGSISSLYKALRKYYTNKDLLKRQRLNVRKMAEQLFDRKKTYPELVKFILGKG